MRVTDVLPMTKEELTRVQVMRELVQKHIKQRHAAKKLGISVRQVKRLKRAYEQDGTKALISKKRGRASSHPLREPVEKQAISLLRKRYTNFGPTRGSISNAKSESNECLLQQHRIHQVDN